ncbi:MAG: hypothetical protein A2583_01390 [Bdellovibrionales bacterium RIFOXYD1_FULL_53_11]|nr:MAG: hypothetical protein A2583_01390 [Bdellovibrionales bacterium RIFOXYD1_FULL_53_11]
MDKLTFKRLSELVYRRSGIVLREGKEALLLARVGKRMRVLGLESPEDYLHFVSDDRNSPELVHLVDVVSTNVTHFFRESAHFTLFHQLLNHWQLQKQGRFAIWSAACSTGQEPYSIAMTADDALAGTGAAFKILATDISTNVLGRASDGIYEKDEVAGVPPDFLHKYFEKLQDGRYRAVAFLRSFITFSRINLSAPPFAMSGPFDVVFCRNVMIYFDDTVRRRLVSEIHRLVKPGGVLMLGHSEAITGYDCGFDPVRPSVYRKRAVS